MRQLCPLLFLVLFAAPVCLAEYETNETPIFSQEEDEAVEEDDLSLPPAKPQDRQAPNHPATAYWNVSAQLTLTSVTPGTHIKMLLPLSDGRQSVVARRTQVEGVRYWEEADTANLWGHWRVMETAPVPDQIRYAYTVQMTDASTPVPQHPFPFQNIDPEAIPYLAASEMIQSDMPQVQQRAWRIVKGETRLDQAAFALYQAIGGFVSPGGKTVHNDALSVLIAEQGGRSGKTRALVALLRAVRIPARVVGGIRLGDARHTQTTLYWAEAFLGDVWVPMDPSSGYFGWLPNTYLALYRNDLPLLVHTQHVSVSYAFVIRPMTRSAAFSTDPQAELGRNSTQNGTAAPAEQARQLHAAYVDRPQASVLLISEGSLVQETQNTVGQILAQAQAQRINVGLFSIAGGSRPQRETQIRTVLEKNTVLLQQANIVVLNTRDAAGLYALLRHQGFADNWHKWDGVQFVLASGVARPVSSVFAAVLFHILGPSSIVLLPYQPDSAQLWQLVSHSLHNDQSLTESASTLAIPSRVVDPATLAEGNWWRRGVIAVWVQAIESQVSVAALNAILVLPLIAFFLVIMRNVIGLETFGFFAPLLLALAFLTTGLGWGLLIFGIVIGIGGGLRLVLQRLRLHLVARVAILIAVVAVSMAGLTVIGAQFGIGALLHVGIFPMVILANMIENFTNTQMERGTREALRLTLNTLLVALVSYLFIENTDLRPLVLAFPELLAVVVGLELLIGCWRGMRLVEYIRFARVLRQAEAQRMS